jgi:hypothetical protein
MDAIALCYAAGEKELFAADDLNSANGLALRWKIYLRQAGIDGGATMPPRGLSFVRQDEGFAGGWLLQGVRERSAQEPLRNQV